MIKQAESLQARRVKAMKAAALVVLFVLVSFAPWSKDHQRHVGPSYQLQVAR
jgi:hypothetical protein